MKLHVGAGRDPLPGWTNLDIAPWDGIDIVCDITQRIPLEDDTVETILCSHCLEHISEPLKAMEELWRVCKPGATAEFHTPYGSSDLAWTDPTHVRPYFIDSWETFGQPYHWRMEMHYGGDWRIDEILLLIRKDLHDIESLTMKEAHRRVWHERNIVREMRAHLTAVKPARKPGVLTATPTIRMEVEA